MQFTREKKFSPQSPISSFTFKKLIQIHQTVVSMCGLHDKTCQKIECLQQKKEKQILEYYQFVNLRKCIFLTLLSSTF